MRPQESRGPSRGDCSGGQGLWQRDRFPDAHLILTRFSDSERMGMLPDAVVLRKGQVLVSVADYDLSLCAAANPRCSLLFARIRRFRGVPPDSPRDRFSSTTKFRSTSRTILATTVVRAII
jgi:hypothetical protein